MIHRQLRRSLVGKPWSLVGIFDKSCLLFPREDEKDIVSASLPRSHLWQHVMILRVRINMQVVAANFEEQRKFAKWVLNVGDDSFLAIAEKEGVDPDWIKILSHMKLPIEDCSLRGLIQTIYLDHQCHFGDAMYFMQCSIMAPKNTNVDEVNNVILESLYEKLHTYFNANSLAPTKESANACCCIVSGGIFEQFNDIANHKLELKVGVLILLLRNLTQSIGLCNGTRLIVKRLGQHVIEVEIIIGNNVGKRVFIPRIIMSPFRIDWPFVLC